MPSIAVQLVTDARALAEDVRRVLDSAGHRVVAAGARDPRPSVVLVGPTDDGRTATESRDAVDAARALRAVAFALEPSDVPGLLSAGFHRAVPVPFSAQELLDAVTEADRGQLRVLLVDDSQLIHRHTVPLLREAGYEVREAWDGREALELLQQSPPDLLLTDVEMPVMNGFALCRAVKSSEQLRHLPVVICSSLGEAEHLREGFDAGADDYLVKPVVPEELVSRLHALLAARLAVQRERIVVVDDSAAVRHLVSDTLRRQGFVVETAVDGEDGLAKVRELLPELVLTDYEMPRRDGFELVHELKKGRETRDIPTIMLTARDGRRDRAQMRAAGLTSFLVKPFSSDKCIAVVERVLAEARLLRYKEASRLYVSEGAVRAAEALSRGKDLGQTRADNVDATLLFSDLSGFTAMSSTMTPQQVVDMLNGSFDELCVVIRKHGGDIDKFIGDAIMAVFVDGPDWDEPHALRAARAAWEMQAALRRYNEVRGADIGMRIGLNCGPVVRGDIGSRFVRRDYTCIGDVVNRAQRHESKAPRNGVLMSQDLYARVGPMVVATELPGLEFKGISAPQSAWVLEGFR